MKVRKFYVRHREGYPEEDMFDSAMRGFRALGIEVAPYTWVDDVDTLPDLGPDVGVCGYVGDVRRALDRIGVPQPAPVDYPGALLDWLGRDVRLGTLDEVTRMRGPVHVKPVKHKLFTGFVWRKDVASRERIASVPEDTKVWVSEYVPMASEHRVFVLHGEIVGACRYSGDWSMAPSRGIVEGAVRTLEEAGALAAYCLDFAVTGDDGRTVLVEMNEGFAFGHRGLEHKVYAQMLAARWAEMTSIACGSRGVR